MRTARICGKLGIYRVVSRGVGQQIIFKADADRRRYFGSLQSLVNGSSGALPDLTKFEEYAACPERIWGSTDEVREFLLNVDVPMGYLFANEDPVFNDWRESNFWAIMNTRRTFTRWTGGRCPCPLSLRGSLISNSVHAFLR